MLTKKQHELLLFINQRLTDTGVSPSFEEMKEALKLKSKSGIHRLISGLEERGFIKRLAHRARALEVVKLPEETAIAAPRAERGRFSPTVIRGDFKSAFSGATPAASTYVDMPMHMLGNGEHYALEIAGDSMIDAGILDGDTIVVQRCDTAENGSIVVALIDDEEVTLKRLRRRGASIALEPANKTYETRIFGPDRVKVQGRLVGLFRRY